jgi:ABC-type multidrug transport system permease subunit
VTGCILAAAIAAGTWLYDMPWSAYLPSLLWVVLLSGLLISIFTSLQLLATSQRGGSILLNLIIFPMMMVGGSFFPPEMMPAWLARIGMFTPNGFGLRILKTLQAGSPDLSSTVAAFAGTALLTVILLWFSSIRLRRKFAGSAS